MSKQPEKKAITRITKEELANLLEVSGRTLAIYLNKKYIDELTPLGYERNQHYVNQSVFVFIVSKMAVNMDELREIFAQR